MPNGNITDLESLAAGLEPAAAVTALRDSEALILPSSGEDGHLRALLQAISAPIYTTDAAGRITFYNEAAELMWGRKPTLGDDQWCGSWKLYWPDGTMHTAAM